MKAILISIQSPHACNILDLIKLWEVRKKFPKYYVGWVYIYVTKALPHLSKTYVGDYEVYDDTQWDKEWLDLNGKVVARFWCDKIKSIWKTTTNIWTYGSDLEPNFYKESCLNDIELDRYFKPTKVGFGKVYGYAIHITKLEIFDKPKEISEFKSTKKKRLSPFVECSTCRQMRLYGDCDRLYRDIDLTRAPQSWCYIEAD